MPGTQEPPGTPLALWIEVPNAPRPVEIEAEVRWVVSGDKGEGENDVGMGVKFSGLEVEQLLALNDYFASLTATVDHDEE